MSPDSQVLPDLRFLHGALVRTTEVLAVELGRAGSATPDWSAQEWRVARAAAAIHGVSGLLCAGVTWQGPEDWQAFIAGQRLQVATRIPRILQLLARIDSGMRAAAIGCVALKGAALHSLGIYTPGERPMADLDLLVPEETAARVSAVLEANGFHAGIVTGRHQTFLPVDANKSPVQLGEDSGTDIKIEVHGGISEALPLRSVDISGLVTPRDLHPGVNPYPTRAALLLHILLHASGSMVNRALRLLHLNDIHRLTRTMNSADWEAVFACAAEAKHSSLWWAYPPLALTQRYFGGIPVPVLERMAFDAPRLLRRVCRRQTLSQVSHSHLWVSAVPGIEWSRSPSEMFAYALRRTIPSRQTLSLRTALAEAQPGIDGGEWAHTSQGRRVLRWLVARQPRQATLQSLYAALLH